MKHVYMRRRSIRRPKIEGCELGIAVTLEEPEQAGVVRLAYIFGVSDVLDVTTPTGVYRIAIEKLEER